MTIKEKLSYIKGLSEGLNLDTTKPEGKLISEMFKLFDKVADELDSLGSDVGELYEYVDELDHDLGDVENEVFECDDDDDEDDEDDDDDWDCDCDCDECSGCDEDLYEAQCPNCGEIVCFDPEIEEEDMICPACNKPFNEGEKE